MIHGSKKKWKKNRKYFDLNEIENTKYQKLWNAADTAFRGKFV